MEELVERLRAHIYLSHQSITENTRCSQEFPNDKSSSSSETSRQVRVLKRAILGLQNKCQFYGIPGSLQQNYIHDPESQINCFSSESNSRSNLQQHNFNSDVPDRLPFVGTLSRNESEDDGNTSETISLNSDDCQNLD